MLLRRLPPRPQTLLVLLSLTDIGRPHVPPETQQTCHQMKHHRRQNAGRCDGDCKIVEETQPKGHHGCGGHLTPELNPRTRGWQELTEASYCI